MTKTSKEKRCCRCHKIYPADLKYFRKESRAKDGLTGACKNCLKVAGKKYQKKYLAKNPAKRKKSLSGYNNSKKGKKAQRKYRRTRKGKALTRRAKLKYRYGITIDDYNKLFQQQNGCCAICGKHQSELKRRLDIDHDHKTNRVRGLLCRGCNRHLGKFEKGRIYNEYLTQKFMAYLKQDNYR